MSYLDSLNRFAQSPVGLDIGRSKFNMPYKHKTTFNSGYLIPLMWKEVLPGDTFKCNVSAVVRSITPVVPVMDDSYLDLYYFFVPNRLCTLNSNDWAKVCGENFSGPWAQSTEETLETTGNFVAIHAMEISTNGFNPQSLSNYLGMPIIGDTDLNNMTGKVNILPYMCYQRIWNEWFRDQNVESPISFSVSECRFLRPVSKFHDYFTSCLPAPQKAASVSLPLGTFAPVVTGATEHHTGPWSAGPLKMRKATDGSQVGGGLGVYNGTGDVGLTNSDVVIAYSGQYPTNLYADLANATAASINAIRLAFALQRFAEKEGLGGSRYREVLKSFYGVTIPDYTVQVPEYLGGKRIPLSITQVLQTSSTDNVSPLGATGAFSNTGFTDGGFVKSFNEYGIVMAVACVRTMQSYSQGVPRAFTRNRRFDFYWPTFANLGEQPVYKYELYADTSTFTVNQTASVFGYQEAWADYRYSPIQVSGYFAPAANDPTLTAWTYTNNFNAAPVLNDSFIHQDPASIGDTLVVPSGNYQFIGDFQFNITATRPMPLYSIPGLIDHH